MGAQSVQLAPVKGVKKVFVSTKKCLYAYSTSHNIPCKRKKWKGSWIFHVPSPSSSPRDPWTCDAKRAFLFSYSSSSQFHPFLSFRISNWIDTHCLRVYTYNGDKRARLRARNTGNKGEKPPFWSDANPWGGNPWEEGGFIKRSENLYLSKIHLEVVNVCWPFCDKLFGDGKETTSHVICAERIFNSKSTHNSGNNLIRFFAWNRSLLPPIGGWIGWGLKPSFLRPYVKANYHQQLGRRISRVRKPHGITDLRR